MEPLAFFGRGRPNKNKNNKMSNDMRSVSDLKHENIGSVGQSSSLYLYDV